MHKLRSFKHFAKHLFLVIRVYVERKNAKEDVYNHLHNMRSSIIRMNLGYSDIEKLRKKIEILINWERLYAKFFKPEDNRTKELKEQVDALEQELIKEKEEKEKIIDENSEKVNQLTVSLNSLKSKVRDLLMERARRYYRLKALENKISESVDLNRYYHS